MNQHILSTFQVIQHLKYDLMCLAYLLFAGAVLCVSCQQTSRSSDDSFIAVSRSVKTKIKYSSVLVHALKRWRRAWELILVLKPLWRSGTSKPQLHFLSSACVVASFVQV